MYKVMLNLSHTNHLGMKRSGALVATYSCERQAQPSNLFAGILPTDWEEAGP
jgi:hypothetical protein